MVALIFQPSTPLNLGCEEMIQSSKNSTNASSVLTQHWWHALIFTCFDFHRHIYRSSKRRTIMTLSKGNMKYCMTRHDLEYINSNQTAPQSWVDHITNFIKAGDTQTKWKATRTDDVQDNKHLGPEENIDCKAILWIFIWSDHFFYCLCLECLS